MLKHNTYIAGIIAGTQVTSSVGVHRPAVLAAYFTPHQWTSWTSNESPVNQHFTLNKLTSSY